MKIRFTDDFFKKIKPSRLISDEKDEVADFFLVLANFYNDFKTQNFFTVEINNTSKGIDPLEINAENGEYGGIKVYLYKLMCGTLNEFFRFLKENQDIFEKTEFKIILEKLNDDLKERWNDILLISKGSQPNGVIFSKILGLIRNNLTFHYYQSGKNLRKGFVQKFFEDTKEDKNKWAYYSIGEAMKDTRFYYCDAALESSICKEVERVGIKYDDFIKDLNKAIEDINFTIIYLMKEYLKNRPYD